MKSSMKSAAQATPLWRKAVSSATIAALIISSPGSSCYQVFAEGLGAKTAAGAGRGIIQPGLSLPAVPSMLHFLALPPAQGLESLLARSRGPMGDIERGRARLMAGLMADPGRIASKRRELARALGEENLIALESAAAQARGLAGKDPVVREALSRLQREAAAWERSGAGFEALLAAWAGSYDGGVPAADGIGAVTASEIKFHPSGLSRAGGSLSETGYGLKPMSELIEPGDWKLLQRQVSGSFDRLAEDPYRPQGASGKRYRAASQMTIIPGEAGDPDLIRTRAGASFLSASAEAGYPGIAPEIMQNPAFRKLIRSIVDQLPREARKNGVRLSIHQMRVADGEVVPEGVHQDEFTDYLGMWVAGRENAGGGESRLYADAEGRRPVFERTLEPSEVLIMDNRKLWHHVSPIGRLKPEGRALRDVFVFAVAALPPRIPMDDQSRRRALSALREEFSKPEPDAALLRRIHESGDPRLQESLYGAFKGWSRYYSATGAAGSRLWKFLKSAAAPWAGRVYLPRLTSFLEFLAQQQKDGGRQPMDAVQEARKIHEADAEFSKAFVAAAEASRPQDLDQDEASIAVSDLAIYPEIIQPILDGRQRGPFDRKALILRLAQRLKDTLYAYSEVTVQEIEGLLREEGPVQARLGLFLDQLERHIPPPRPPEASAKPQGSRAAPSAVKRLAQGGMMTLLLVAASLLWNLITGGEGHGHMLLGGMMGMMGAMPPGNEPGNSQPAQGGSAGSKAPYLTDLTAQARNGELAPIYLRDDEIDKTVQVLNQKAYNNVFLIGEPGVGKTAIAEGLAERIAHRQTGTELDEQRVLLLEVGKFLAAAGATPDSFAAAVGDLVREAADGKTVLVIDEAHQLARDPSSPAVQLSFFDQIKTAMTQGRLKLMLATTLDEHRRFFAADRALESRSQVVPVEPVKEGPAIELLYRVRGRFEHGVRVTYGAAKAAVELTVRAFRFDALLRMAIKALDRAATRLRIRPAQVKLRLLSTRRNLLYHLDLLRRARAEKDLERQEDLIPQIRALIEDYRRYQEEFLKPPRAALGRQDVAEALSELGAPVHSLEQDTQERLAGIEKLLRSQLIGHKGLIDQTLAALKRSFAQPNRRKPIFSSLLLGPTGTGKTEFARLLGKALFGIADVEKSVIKIDGGQYQMKHEQSKIIGSPPGYVGFGETRTLFDQVRERPESIILVDEVEKMHADIKDLFLSILEDGSAKDAKGRPVDFSNTVIVFTSNFGVPPGEYEKLGDEEFIRHVRGQLKLPYGQLPGQCPFKPEFLNRLDLVDVFTTLKPAELRDIVRLRLGQIRRQMKREHGIEVEFADEEKAFDGLLKEGYDARNGARALNRTIDRRVEGALTELFVSKKLRGGDKAVFREDWSVEVREAAEGRSPVLSLPGAEGRALAARIERWLGEAAESPLTLDQMDQALEPALPQDHDPSFNPRKPPAGFSPRFESEPLKQHTPLRNDLALKPVLDRLKEDLADRPAEWALAVEQGLKNLALKAKRLNLEFTARSLEGPEWERGFFELEAAAAGMADGKKAPLQKRLGEIVERANKERSVRLSWDVAGGRLRAVAEADGSLAYEEELKLRELFSSGEAVPADAQDAALAEWKKAFFEAGGKAGYFQENGKTRLWLEWPMPSAAKAKEKAEAPKKAGEPALIEVETIPSPDKVEPRQAALAMPGEPGYINIFKPDQDVPRRERLRGVSAAIDSAANPLVSEYWSEVQAKVRENPHGTDPSYLPLALEWFDSFFRVAVENSHGWNETKNLRFGETEDGGLILAVGAHGPYVPANIHEIPRYQVLFNSLTPETRDEEDAKRLSADLLNRKLRGDLSLMALKRKLKLIPGASLGLVGGYGHHDFWLQLPGRLPRNDFFKAYAPAPKGAPLVSNSGFISSREDQRLQAFRGELSRRLAAVPLDPKHAALALEWLDSFLPFLEREFKGHEKFLLGTEVLAMREENSGAPALGINLRYDEKVDSGGLSQLFLRLQEGLWRETIVETPDRPARTERHPSIVQDSRLAEALGGLNRIEGAAMGSEYHGRGMSLWLRLPVQEPRPAPEKAAKKKTSVQQPAQEEAAAPKAEENLSLVQHAERMMDTESSEEAVVESANALARALGERPQSATADLEKVLWSGIAAFRADMDQLQNKGHAIEDSVVVWVGGRYVPVRRIRDNFELYQRLIQTRPDLAPADIAQKIRDGLSMKRMRYETYYSEFRQDRLSRLDKKGSDAAIWSLTQTLGLANVLNEKRPDLVTLKDLVSFSDLIRKRKEDRHEDIGILAGLQFILGIIGLVATVFMGFIPWVSVFVPYAAIGFLAGGALTHFVFWSISKRIANPPLRKLERSLFQTAIARARTLPPIEVLRAIASFDAKVGQWEPGVSLKTMGMPGHLLKALFDELWNSWPQFRAEASGKSLGAGPVPHQEAALLSLAEALTAGSRPHEEAFGDAKRLARALEENPSLASKELERRLRQAIFEGKNLPPFLRTKLFEIYLQLVRSRPELADEALKAPLPMALPESPQWRARIVDAVDQARPGFVSMREAMVFRREVGRWLDISNLLARSARRSPVREVLDAIAEFDAEKGAWFPKPDFDVLFGTLMRQWARFGRAARGQQPAAAGEPDALEALKEESNQMLEYLAAEPTGIFRSRQEMGQGMISRIQTLQKNGGVPREVRDGLIHMRTELAPLAPELLQILPELSSTIQRLTEQRWNDELWPSDREQFLRDSSDLLYSLRKLGEQAQTKEKMLSDFRWVFGTYRLGDPAGHNVSDGLKRP